MPKMKGSAPKTCLTNPRAAGDEAESEDVERVPRQLEDLPDDRANENQAREGRSHGDAVKSEVA